MLRAVEGDDRRLRSVRLRAGAGASSLSSHSSSETTPCGAPARRRRRSGSRNSAGGDPRLLGRRQRDIAVHGDDRLGADRLGRLDHLGLGGDDGDGAGHISAAISPSSATTPSTQFGIATRTGSPGFRRGSGSSHEAVDEVAHLATVVVFACKSHRRRGRRVAEATTPGPAPTAVVSSASTVSLAQAPLSCRFRRSGRVVHAPTCPMQHVRPRFGLESEP